MFTSYPNEILLEMTNPLTMLINKSFVEGYFPDELKVAKIIPVPKHKGEVEKINKFRPISILPTISKVFEAALKNRLMKYLEQNDLFSESQNGYRSGRSTITATLDLYKKITSALDNREIVEVAMCDLSKAFDILPHKLILQKLQYNGIREMTF
ncbi:putative RNA-directed DNA polymerase from transposon X-element-like Protein [Tribolium castaneum]|uniref:Putative RNA-directed DNA polymerase from transposon X-element-like Protein n=1 Tax=Tribolium castaneum TaxID=7070 RepID=D7EHS3_TRICA|nr:putative RNA-directed DNA polymerase from transposon X-element-like Protein [Tribolium castaneum]